MRDNLDFNYKKATQAVNYFANKQNNKVINKMKALKLIWLADRYHIRRYGRPITGDEYMAMKLGPVASSLKDIIEQHDPYLDDAELSYSAAYIILNGANHIKSKDDVDLDVFSETDIEALDFVYKSYGHLDQFELSELSHKYPEWARFEQEFNSKNTTRKRMNYLDFFGPAVTSMQEDKFNEDKEVLESSKEIFQESTSLNNSFQ